MFGPDMDVGGGELLPDIANNVSNVIGTGTRSNPGMDIGEPNGLGDGPNNASSVIGAGTVSVRKPDGADGESSGGTPNRVFSVIGPDATSDGFAGGIVTEWLAGWSGEEPNRASNVIGPGAFDNASLVDSLFQSAGKQLSKRKGFLTVYPGRVNVDSLGQHCAISPSCRPLYQLPGYGCFRMPVKRRSDSPRYCQVPRAMEKNSVSQSSPWYRLVRQTYGRKGIE